MSQMEVDSSRYENAGAVEKGMKTLAKYASSGAQARFRIEQKRKKDEIKAAAKAERDARKAADRAAATKRSNRKAQESSKRRIAEAEKKTSIRAAAAKEVITHRENEAIRRKTAGKPAAKKTTPGVKKDGTPSKRTPAKNVKDTTLKVPGTRSRGGAPKTTPVNSSKARVVPKVAVPKTPGIKPAPKTVAKVKAPTATRRTPKKG